MLSLYKCKSENGKIRELVPVLGTVATWWAGGGPPPAQGALLSGPFRASAVCLSVPCNDVVRMEGNAVTEQAFRPRALPCSLGQLAVRRERWL